MFLDESGDLGKHPPGSRFFVIAILVTQSVRQFEKIERRTRERFHPRGELKFNSSNERVRNFVLDRINDNDCKIAWIAMDKTIQPPGFRIWPSDLYQRMTGKVFEHVLDHSAHPRVTFSIDRFSISKLSPADFEKFVREMFATHRTGSPSALSVSSYDSQRSPGLQVNDFVPGSIFRMLEHDESDLYGVIKQRVIWWKII